MNNENKTCDNLVNYQLIENDKIVVYNISTHEVWNEIVNCLNNEQKITTDYCVCMHCSRLKLVGKNIPIASLVQCKCTESTSTIHNMSISEGVGIIDFVDSFLNNEDDTRITQRQPSISSN